MLLVKLGVLTPCIRWTDPSRRRPPRSTEYTIDHGGTGRFFFASCLDHQLATAAADGSLSGEVAEWSNAHAWKACIGANLSGVRIPPSPPFYVFSRRSAPTKPSERLVGRNRRAPETDSERRADRLRRRPCPPFFRGTPPPAASPNAAWQATSLREHALTQTPVSGNILIDAYTPIGILNLTCNHSAATRASPLPSNPFSRTGIDPTECVLCSAGL